MTQRHVAYIHVERDGTPTEDGQHELDRWAQDGWQVFRLGSPDLDTTPPYFAKVELVREAPST